MKKIIAYVKGELEGQEKAEFEQEILSDTALAEDVENTRISALLIKAKGISDLKEQLNSYSTELEQKSAKEPSIRPLIQWISGLAACLILGIGLYLFFHKSSASNQELYSQYFKPYQNIVMPAVMGESIEENTLKNKQEAFYAYDSRNYELAIKLFNEIPEKEKDSYLIFYLGNAYLAIGKSHKAAQMFSQLLQNDKNFILIDQTRWYLSLSYLKSNKIDKAKAILNDLINTNREYGKRAQEIVEKLR